MTPDRRLSLRFARLLVALTVMLSLLGLTPIITHAATLDVCPSGCTHSSIQAAINAAAPGDTLTIKAGTYNERLSIGKNLTLQGADASTTTINGGGGGTTITVAAGTNVAIGSVTVTGGSTTGIVNLGTLTLTNSTVSGNTAFQGAGIRNNSGATLTLTNSTVSDNTASDSAGGMINNGGAATISNSTISGNKGGFGGGGILNTNAGSMTIINSTISGNSGTGVAGGIWNLAPLTIINSTFSGNSAPSAAGIFFDQATTVKNTIIASNAGPNCGFQFGTISDGGGNLSSDTSCNFTAANSISNTNAQLDSTGLKDNGGPTNTIALLPSSPAINTGDASICADASTTNNTDQRGQSRSNDQCDIGAYELQPAATSLSVAAALGSFGGTTSFSAALTQNGNPVGNRSVSFTLNGSAAGSATTDTSGVATVANVSLSGINTGTYSITATFAGVSPFNASTGSGSLTVGKVNQAVTLAGVPGSAAYASTFTPSASSDQGLPVAISVSGGCSLSGTTVTMSSGTGICTVTADQAGNATYNAASASANVYAQKVALTITADTLSKVYGASLPALTVHYAGLVSNDTPAALGGSLSCSTTATASSPAGAYAITCSGQTSDNYSITYQPGTLNIINAFPTSSVLDSFNRANGKVGSNWDGLTDQAFYKIASNTLDVQLGGPLVWKPTSFGTTQEAFVTLRMIDAKNPSQGLLLKVQSGSIPDSGAISVVYDAKAKAVRVSALRLGRNGAWTLYPNQAATFANGDVLGARAKANGTVEIYKNGTLIASVALNAADQAFFNAKGGKIGIWTVAASNAVLDDFGGGAVAQ